MTKKISAGILFIILGVVKPILELLEHWEYISEHIKSLHNSGDFMEYIINPPSWVSIILVIIGLFFIYGGRKPTTKHFKGISIFIVILLGVGYEAWYAYHPVTKSAPTLVAEAPKPISQPKAEQPIIQSKTENQPAPETTKSLIVVVC